MFGNQPAPLKTSDLMASANMSGKGEKRGGELEAEISMVEGPGNLGAGHPSSKLRTRWRLRRASMS